ncbi:DUF1992 domain-containing protein [Franconibacter helveticus]|uniref:DnaJ family domain-containing protein n=1 Tax=Franconibacter helveticus TaxID=357240 RepID=UPI000DA1A553|nr:DUF1992 domain-containing protein [Franconibacter helveticus]MDU6926952.1 DUF1992 domain-containing protein [Franconibacter helveticus]
MWLIDQWAEKHILDAQKKGEMDGLAGEGKPLALDDDSAVPAGLRASYRLLKNAGYLPPELQQRKEALELADMLKSIADTDPQHPLIEKRLALLELKLRQAGVNTDFLHGEYAERFAKKIHQG